HHLPPPRSPLFPYTTLFRSRVAIVVGERDGLAVDRRAVQPPRVGEALAGERQIGDASALEPGAFETSLPSDLEAMQRSISDAHRSEEHTSELQSPCNLVCRL